MEPQIIKNSEIIEILDYIFPNLSNELGEEYLGDGYILKYEIMDESSLDIPIIETLEKISDLDIDENEAVSIVKDACIEYSLGQTPIIINSWLLDRSKKDYNYVSGGFREDIGDFGIIWAVFRYRLRI